MTNGAYGTTSTEQPMIRMENGSITGTESNKEWKWEVTEEQEQKVK